MKLETFSLRCYPMPLRIRVILTSVLLLALAAPATAQLRKLNIAYTATSPYQAALIIAKEAGIFKNTGWIHN